MATPSPTHQTSPFFRLPAELRNNVYNHAITHWNSTLCRHYVWKPITRQFPPLVYACSQIHTEAGTLYCATVIFYYYRVADLVQFLAALSKRWRRAIRTLEWANSGSPFRDATDEVLKEHHWVLSWCSSADDLKEASLRTHVALPHSEILSYRLDEDL